MSEQINIPEEITITKPDGRNIWAVVEESTYGEAMQECEESKSGRFLYTYKGFTDYKDSLPVSIYRSFNGHVEVHKKEENFIIGTFLYSYQKEIEEKND